MERIYLDNAATSWPKPEAVYQAVDHYQRHVGAAAGRGAYREADFAQSVVQNARLGCAALIGAADPQRIAFLSNGTDALNVALHGLLCEGDRVVATDCEHNSVLRPLAALAERRRVTSHFVSCNSEGYVDPDQIADALRIPTRLVVVSHASNVTGAVQPLAQIAKAAHRHNALLLVDAAQTIGHLPIDVVGMDIDFLAASGHKGLLAPLGTGLLFVKSGLEAMIEPQRQGGTGSDSQSEVHPQKMPDRLEAGNLNVTSLAGLAAAANFLAEQSTVEIAAHEHALVQLLLGGLRRIPRVRAFGPSADQPRVAVVSFALENYDPHDVAAALDASFHIQCRAGLHCAPRMHRALNTLDSGGLVRLSPGWSTSSDEIQRAVDAIATLTATLS